MMQFLGQPFIVLPLIGAIVFVLAYLWSDRALAWLHKRSLGQREEVLRLLDSMFVETSPRSITALMLLSSFGLGLLFFILLWPHLILGLLLGCVITFVGWSLPYNMVKSLWEKRCNRLVDQMIDALTIMGNGIRSGLSITQSMERVVENMGNPISQEFGLVLSQIRIGRSVEDALTELGERIPRPDIQMFVTSINVLKETGGNLAETFSTTVITIRERQKVEKKIEALTAQGLTQGVIITLVPFLLIIVYLVVDPSYIKPMFTTTMGIFLMILMLALQIIGGVMVRKIAKINV